MWVLGIGIIDYLYNNSLMDYAKHKTRDLLRIVALANKQEVKEVDGGSFFGSEENETFFGQLGGDRDYRFYFNADGIHWE